MARISLSVSVVVTLALFAAGVALATTGLATEYWMTWEMSPVEARVGLFRICVDVSYTSRCISTVDIDIDDAGVYNPTADVVDFLVCKICMISGIVLGVSGIVACAIFFLFNIKSNRMSKGPFIATMISGISAVICIACAVLAFGVLIHKESDHYDLDYSFTLTCVSIAFLLIGCIVFAIAAQPFLKAARGGVASNGVVYATDPQMMSLPAAQNGMPQQPGVQYSVPHQPGVQYGIPQQQGVQQGYGWSGPQKTF